MRPTARARAAPRRRDRPAIAWLPPRLRRHVRGRFERLEIGHEFPDGIGRQQTAIRRHAVRLAVTNRLEDLRIGAAVAPAAVAQDRKSTRLNSSHLVISYAVFCLKKKKKIKRTQVLLA